MKYKRSKQRQRLLELLEQTDTHPAADWLYQKLKKEFARLSLATVYRNLNVLVAQKRIQKLPFVGTYDRYEVIKHPHYHLVCRACGSVQDFDMPHDAKIDRQAQKMSGFAISGHRIDFFGTCQKCQRKTNRSKGVSNG